MDLHQLLQSLRTVAPEPLAEDWDAVGLQVGWHDQPVRRAMLCIDLSEPVFAEAVEQGVDLIVAYHPPIFKPVTALTDRDARGRILLEAIRRDIAIYSPHTALDSAAGGVNDWLADGLGDGERRPVRPVTAETIGHLREPSFTSSATEQGDLPPAADGAGQGRVLALAASISLTELATRLKDRLNVDRIEVGLPDAPDGPDGGEQRIQRIGLCPGAGASLLPEAGEVQAFITGEMRHHDQLAAKAAGIAVLLAGHSQSERPYLPTYRRRLIDAGTGDIDWRISEADRAPTAPA